MLPDKAPLRGQKSAVGGRIPVQLADTHQPRPKDELGCAHGRFVWRGSVANL